MDGATHTSETVDETYTVTAVVYDDELLETARNRAEAWAQSKADGPMSFSKMFSGGE